MTFKFTQAHFTAPTPKKIRMWGNAMVTMATSASGWTFLAGHPYIAAAVAAIGVVGKIILSFFAEDTSSDTSQNTTK